jgi:hypothetical protein
VILSASPFKDAAKLLSNAGLKTADTRLLATGNKWF